jgi:glycosyltransferase involved in cell wall biosynthesis
MKPVRVAFRYIDSRAWQGGYNYLLNLHRALVAERPPRVQPVLFCGVDAPEADLARFAGLLGEDLIRSPVFAPDALKRRRPRTLLSGRDRVAEAEFGRVGVQVVFENADFYGRAFALPTIAWVPDFQHRHLPGMFGPANLIRRELGFQAQFRSGRRVMVSSEDARGSCMRSYGVPKERIDVVRFAVPYAGRPSDDEVQRSIEAHGLPARYFFLPNQFWRHKNHDAVVDAVRRLRERGRTDIVVAASGGASHPTNEAVLARVRRRTDERGLGSTLRLLGRIPYADVVGLLLGCRALLQPSRFEGWSTTIEEAKALGVPTVLSDLPVHREQAPDAAAFFDPARPEQLADALEAVQDAPAGERPPDAVLVSAAEARIARFVDEFVAVVDRASKAPERRRWRPVATGAIF